MMHNLPNYIVITFILTTLLTFILFYLILKKSSLKNKTTSITIGLLFWLTIQAFLSYSLFYVDTVGDMPPKFALLGFMPAFIFMAVLFNTKKGRVFIDSLPLRDLTFLSIVRIPVEIVLFWLFINNVIPEILTFEGRNFDILAGITAPIVAYFAFSKEKLNRNLLLGWNIICLLLLINIVLNAVLSFPTVFQQFAFEQPNIGILYFPFFWLPSFIVPIVFFTHFVSIRRLLKINPKT